MTLIELLVVIIILGLLAGLVLPKFLGQEAKAKVEVAKTQIRSQIGTRPDHRGTLRALGFSRRSILASFLIESVILAVIGGAVGCLLAFPMNGFSTGTGTDISPAISAFADGFTLSGVDVGLARS